MSESEEWRSIPGYEKTYRVSSLGRVESLPRPTTRGGIRVTPVNPKGYPYVSLSQNGQQKTHSVHRLVALAFIGPRPAGHETRHLDGDSLNSRASNLAYGTPSQNGRDKRAHGTDHNVAKDRCPAGHAYDEENTRVLGARRYCRACGSARRDEGNRARNAASRPLAIRARQIWTDEETATILRDDITLEEAARLVGRSFFAARRQRTRARKLDGWREEWS